jgi:hypothetical protein
MDTQLLPIVPFGKYKGKPFTDLLADEKYVDWLKQQPWFPNQKQIYNIVVHQSISPVNNNEKTPAHNQLQNMFLSEDNQLKLLSHILINGFQNKLNSLFADEIFIKYFGLHNIPKITIDLSTIKIIFEDKFNWDIVLYHDPPDISFHYISNLETEIIEKTSYKNKYDEEQQAIFNDKINNSKNYKNTMGNSIFTPTYDDINKDKQIYQKKFEETYEDIRKIFYKQILNKYFPHTSYVFKENENQYTAKIRVLSEDYDYALCCELKPTLSDDYPCVLRKMKTQIQLTKNDNTKFNKFIMRYILIIGNFISAYTSKEQLVAIFKQSNIHVIFADELFGPSNTIEYINTNQLLPDSSSIMIENNKILSYKLSQAEEKNRQLEDELVELKRELLRLKTQSQSRNIKDYFVKK